MVVESELDALHMDTSTPEVTPAIAVAAQAPEFQEDQLDTTVIPEAESNLPSHEVKTEGSSIKEGDHDAVQNSSPSLKSFVDIEVQPEAQVIPSDVSDVADDHERSEKESHLEVVNFIQPDLIMVRIRSGIDMETLKSCSPSLQQNQQPLSFLLYRTEQQPSRRWIALRRSIQRSGCLYLSSDMTIVSWSVFQASAVDRGNALSTQTEDLTMEQLKRDAQIKSIDPTVQEVCPLLTTTATGFDALSSEGCCQ